MAIATRGTESAAAVSDESINRFFHVDRIRYRSGFGAMVDRDPLLLQSLNLTQLPEAASWVDEAGVLHQLWVSGSSISNPYVYGLVDAVNIPVLGFWQATILKLIPSNQNLVHMIFESKQTLSSSLVNTLAYTYVFCYIMEAGSLPAFDDNRRAADVDEEMRRKRKKMRARFINSRPLVIIRLLAHPSGMVKQLKRTRTPEPSWFSVRFFEEHKDCFEPPLLAMLFILPGIIKILLLSSASNVALAKQIHDSTSLHCINKASQPGLEFCSLL
ncbi:hypothetical protein AKJ16_DCAP20695, partial [Drosera capensis]